MKAATATHDEIRESVTLFQIFMILLSIYVLVALFVGSMFELSPEMDGLLGKIVFIVCIIFMGDFFHRWPRKFFSVKSSD